MSALESPPLRLEDMEYDTQCSEIWRLSHAGLTVKQMAADLQCDEVSIYAIARSEGIGIRGRLPSPDWPTKDFYGWRGTTQDTVRQRNWLRQVEGARRTRWENEANDNLATTHIIQALIPTNNNNSILACDTYPFHGANTGKKVFRDGADLHELSTA